MPLGAPRQVAVKTGTNTGCAVISPMMSPNAEIRKQSGDVQLAAALFISRAASHTIVAMRRDRLIQFLS
jgi:hypothetical protein